MSCDTGSGDGGGLPTGISSEGGASSTSPLLQVLGFLLGGGGSMSVGSSSFSPEEVLVFLFLGTLGGGSWAWTSISVSESSLVRGFVNTLPLPRPPRPLEALPLLLLLPRSPLPLPRRELGLPRADAHLPLLACP